MGINGIQVSEHCTDRFIEKTNSKAGRDKVKVKILEMIGKAQLVELKKGYRANQIIRNGFCDAQYLRMSDWVFVIDPTEKVVITCYPASSLRWVLIN